MNRKLAVVASVTGAALAAEVSNAGHLGYWNSPDDFYVRVSYMVDFDQSRDASFFNPPFVTGLPGAGGMYCVPTSSSDLMAYVDRHGFDGVPGVDGPGLENWSDEDDTLAYNIATSYIRDMGLDMNTSATGGTNNNNNQIYNAVRGRLPGALFDVCYYGRTDTWAPKASNIGNWMKQGGIVQFCYGRWNIGASGDDLVSRDTGHCVVATKIDKRAFMQYDDNEYVINYADPGSGGSSLFTQSDFAYRAEQVLDDNYFLTDEGVFRRMSRIMIGNDGRHRLIDSALAIFPKSAWGVYPTPGQFSVVGGAFQAGNGGGGDITTQTFDMPGDVLAAEVAPDRSFASVMVASSAGGSSLYNLDLASGETTRIDAFDDPDPVMVHERSRLLIIITDGSPSVPAQIHRYEMDTDLPAGEARIVETANLRQFSASDVAFEDATDRIAVLGDASGDGTVDALDFGTWERGSGMVVEESYAIPQPQNAGDPHYDWIELTAEYDPATGAQPGDIVLGDSDTGSILVMIKGRGTNGEPVLEPVASLDLGGPIQGLSAGDEGRLFVTQDGVVGEYVYDAAGRSISRVDPADASPFDGVGSLSGFQISRSRTNFVAELHSGPAWENVDPSLIPPATHTVGDCLADIAEPFEVLDLSDIAVFIDGFVNQDPIADINADGVFDLGDVTAFIEGFTAGCS